MKQYQDKSEIPNDGMNSTYITIWIDEATLVDH